MSDRSSTRRGHLGLGLLSGVAFGLMIVGLFWVVLAPAVDDPSRHVPVASGTPSLTPTRTPSRTPTPTPQPGVVTSLPAGEYLTVLDSLPKASTTVDGALAIAAAVSTDEHEAIVVDSDRIPGLTRGYYAVVVPHLSTREDAEQVCQDLGLDVGTSCYPRRVTG